MSYGHQDGGWMNEEQRRSTETEQASAMYEAATAVGSALQTFNARDRLLVLTECLSNEARELQSAKNPNAWRVLDGNMIYSGDTFIALTTAPRCAETICAAHNKEAF